MFHFTSNISRDQESFKRSGFEKRRLKKSEKLVYKIKKTIFWGGGDLAFEIDFKNPSPAVVKTSVNKVIFLTKHPEGKI